MAKVVLRQRRDGILQEWLEARADQNFSLVQLR
jgi:hypothetical protein